MSRFAHPDLSQTGRLVVGHGTTIKASEPTMPKDISKHRLFADFTGADPRGREAPGDVIVTIRPSGGTIEPGRKSIGTRHQDVAPEAGTVSYPDGNPKTAMGAKKPDLSVVPASSLLHLATAMMNGSEKYGPYNYRDQPVSARTYVAAGLRHLLAYLDGEDFSADTVEAGRPVHHLAHVMACCAILLDTTEVGTLLDNRPAVKGRTGSMIEQYNKNSSFKDAE